eukprot:11085382-Alexandrium_andersonii.AAC.1
MDCRAASGALAGIFPPSRKVEPSSLQRVNDDRPPLVGAWMAVHIVLLSGAKRLRNMRANARSDVLGPSVSITCRCMAHGCVLQPELEVMHMQCSNNIGVQRHVQRACV